MQFLFASGVEHYRGSKTAFYQFGLLNLIFLQCVRFFVKMAFAAIKKLYIYFFWSALLVGKKKSHAV